MIHEVSFAYQRPVIVNIILRIITRMVGIKMDIIDPPAHIRILAKLTTKNSAKRHLVPIPHTVEEDFLSAASKTPNFPDIKITSTAQEANAHLSKNQHETAPLESLDRTERSAFSIQFRSQYEKDTPAIS